MPVRVNVKTIVMIPSTGHNPYETGSKKTKGAGCGGNRTCLTELLSGLNELTSIKYLQKDLTHKHDVGLLLLFYLIILFNSEQEQQFPGSLKNTKCTSFTGPRVICFKKLINLSPREGRVKKDVLN